MRNLGPVSIYQDEGIYPVTIEGQDFLVIQHNGQLFCVENKCGHFGVPLANGRVRDNIIYCREHGIGFNLFDGLVKKSMGEDCDAINVVKLIERDGILYCKT